MSFSLHSCFSALLFPCLVIYLYFHYHSLCGVASPFPPLSASFIFLLSDTPLSVCFLFLSQPQQQQPVSVCLLFATKDGEERVAVLQFQRNLRHFLPVSFILFSSPLQNCPLFPPPGNVYTFTHTQNKHIMQVQPHWGSVLSDL